MPPAAPSSSRPKPDVRALSLAQLQQLADRGSRRARAELEGRMRASGQEPPAAPAAPRTLATRPVQATAPRPAGLPADALPTLTTPVSGFGPTPAGDAPALRPRAAANAASLRASVPASVNSTGTAAMPHGAAPLRDVPAGAPASPDEALAQQLQMLARQDEQRARAAGAPRLVGMALIAWGLMLVLGGLVMLGHGSGLYYLFCGVAAGAVGALLMQLSRWAMALHGVLIALALAWAWRNNKGSLMLALIQAAPLLIPALWMAVRPVREPLE